MLELGRRMCRISERVVQRATVRGLKGLRKASPFNCVQCSLVCVEVA